LAGPASNRASWFSSPSAANATVRVPPHSNPNRTGEFAMAEGWKEPAAPASVAKGGEKIFQNVC
jgi:hypothetical protein